VAGSTVLVVDDEPRIVEFLLENLRADDYSVLTASNGEEAIDVLSRTRPDLILLDVVLPGMSGIDVCRRVRGGDAVNDPWDPNLPIIMLSAKAEHTDRVRGLSRGADDYVTKPFHYPELLGLPAKFSHKFSAKFHSDFPLNQAAVGPGWAWLAAVGSAAKSLNGTAKQAK
jgi:CheY-like chemotaxis protein